MKNNEKYHDLGCGVSVKHRLTNSMELKLKALVQTLREGNWKSDIVKTIIDMALYKSASNDNL